MQITLSAPSAAIQKLARHYLPKDFTITTWEKLEPFFQELVNRELPDINTLTQWLTDLSEVEAMVSEDACWRQINMTRDTTNKDYEEAFQFFVMVIQPQLQAYADLLNKKLVQHPLVGELPKATFEIYLRNVRKSIDLFREANIPIQAELGVLQQQYGVIAGKMTVTISNKEYTLQQAAKFLEQSDRSLREEVYVKINTRRAEDATALNELFDQLLAKRHQIALNAGFENYRDYKFKELGRFDYTPEDCFQFHTAVEEHIVPLVKVIQEEQQKKLGLDKLRPWDLDAEVEGVSPLQPFTNGEELLEKMILCFEKIRPFFADCLRKMKTLDHLDLDSRKGKAPGGYNCPLAESGAPFIFMNAAGSMSDVTTMVHEGGHAVHSFLSHPLPLTGLKEYSSEIAEVASMSMELFSMNHWDVFFDQPEDLRRAKIHQLERAITIFPWIASIDAFQHWLYTHPGHTPDERTTAWLDILDRFNTGVVDHSGFEHFRALGWQRQLHLFEVPFYYIEYGIAQLGAIGMWKQYIDNPEQALDNYCLALQLGGSRSLPELYATAGIAFDFSPGYISQLMAFVADELKKLYKN